MVEVLGMTVAELLTASRAAHQEAMPKKGKPRDPVAMQRAADLRIQALALDPDMTDPAWGKGKGEHESVMAFYNEKLGQAVRTAYQQTLGKPLVALYPGARAGARQR